MKSIQPRINLNHSSRTYLANCQDYISLDVEPRYTYLRHLSLYLRRDFSKRITGLLTSVYTHGTRTPIRSGCMVEIEHRQRSRQLPMDIRPISARKLLCKEQTRNSESKYRVTTSQRHSHDGIYRVTMNGMTTKGNIHEISFLPA